MIVSTASAQLSESPSASALAVCVSANASRLSTRFPIVSNSPSLFIVLPVIRRKCETRSATVTATPPIAARDTAGIARLASRAETSASIALSSFRAFRVPSLSVTLRLPASASGIFPAIASRALSTFRNVAETCSLGSSERNTGSASNIAVANASANAPGTGTNSSYPNAVSTFTNWRAIRAANSSRTNSREYMNLSAFPFPTIAVSKRSFASCFRASCISSNGRIIARETLSP